MLIYRAFLTWMLAYLVADLDAYLSSLSDLVASVNLVFDLEARLSSC
jgi:hypothetical protein